MKKKLINVAIEIGVKEIKESVRVWMRGEDLPDRVWDQVHITLMESYGRGRQEGMYPENIYES